MLELVLELGVVRIRWQDALKAISHDRFFQIQQEYVYLDSCDWFIRSRRWILRYNWTTVEEILSARTQTMLSMCSKRLVIKNEWIATARK